MMYKAYREDRRVSPPAREAQATALAVAPAPRERSSLLDRLGAVLGVSSLLCRLIRRMQGQGVNGLSAPAQAAGWCVRRRPERDRDIFLIIESEADGVRHMPLLEGQHQTRAFTSPEQGFAACMAIQPDVVLLSLSQERGNGLELCRAIRDQAGPDLPILLYGSPATRQHRQLLRDTQQLASRFGFTHFLQRSPTTADIDIILRTRLSMHRAQQPERPARAARTWTARRNDHEIARNYSMVELIQSGASLRLVWMKFMMTLAQR